MTAISTVKGRDALKPRRDPYFMKLGTGQYLGFRKQTGSSTGSWIARWRDEAAGKQNTRSLGEFGDLPASERFDAAKRACDEWFARLGLGGSTAIHTVQSACEAYVQHQRARKGDVAADEIAARFGRWVYADTKLRGVELGKLRRMHLDEWRARLSTTRARVNRAKNAEAITRPRSPASVNRDMVCLRAALNFAHDKGEVTTDLAWRIALRPTKNADGRRDLYLDKAQRRSLIDHAAPDVAMFLQGLSLLPLRPGALAGLQVRHFDGRRGVLTIGKDKSGESRRIALPAATARFFSELADGRPQDAPLLAQADGTAWNKDDWKHPIKNAVLAAGLPPSATAYTIRHSTISDLVQGGLDLMTTAHLSGTSVEMIERHYAHLLREHATRALASLAL